MRIRKIDGNGDFTFGKGLQSYARDEEAIDQNIKTRVLSWVGDCFFALNQGVDWSNRLDYNQKENLMDEIKTIILQSYGVLGITDFSYTFDGETRNIIIKYNVDTIFGQDFQSTITQGIGV